MELGFVFLVVPRSVKVQNKVWAILRIEPQSIPPVLLHGFEGAFGDGLNSHDQQDLFDVRYSCLLLKEGIDNELK